MGKASFWQRLAAFAFDLIFVAMVTAGIYLVTLQMSQYFPQAGLTDGPYDLRPPWPANILNILFAAVYFAGSWALWGQTPGKMALNIRVAGMDGERLGYKKAFVRLAAALAGSLLLGLGFWWFLFDRDRGCWHDKMAGSQVVKVDATGEGALMNSWRRWVVAGVMALVLLGNALATWVWGKLLGGFTGPVYDVNLDDARWWLDRTWQVVLAAGALTPPLLLGLKRSWRWVLAGMAAGFTASVLSYLGWFFYVIFFA